MTETSQPSGGSRARGVFAISVAADMVSMQIQNLRVYERHGLVEPDRTPGGTRLYSPDDIDRLTRVRELLADGLNLAGIARVIALESEVERLQAENQRLRSRSRADNSAAR
jgi:MerR family transcriptional regulator/heat shock protein HspR